MSATVVSKITEGLRQLRVGANLYAELNTEEQKGVRHTVYKMLGAFAKEQGIEIKTLLPRLKALNDKYGHPVESWFVFDSTTLPEILLQAKDGDIIHVGNEADAQIVRNQDRDFEVKVGI